MKQRVDLCKMNMIGKHLSGLMKRQRLSILRKSGAKEGHNWSWGNPENPKDKL